MRVESDPRAARRPLPVLIASLAPMMMESQIKQWDAEVDHLNAKAKQMSADARARYEEQIKAMRVDRDTAYS